MSEELTDKQKQKLYKIKEKYKIHENLIIARVARKTLRFIEKILKISLTNIMFLKIE